MTCDDSDSNKIEKIVDKRLLDDTACRAHRAQTHQLQWIGKLVLPVALAWCASNIAFAIVTTGKLQASQARDQAQDKRLDDFGPMIIKMQDAALDIAMDVGQMKGLWAARLQD